MVATHRCFRLHPLGDTAVVTELVGALDQGTSSTRFAVFDPAGSLLSLAQREHRQLLPRPGWVEHDAIEIWEQSVRVMTAALDSLGLRIDDLSAVGIANQRETTIVWSRTTGKPIAPAIVWQDTRTAARAASLGADVGVALTEVTGLPVSPYPSATKLEWLLEHVHGAREAAARGDLLFGTVDSWLIWKLTGRHITDVTNASRTMLMNLATLDWDDAILARFGVPRSMLPEIGPSTRGADELILDSEGLPGRTSICALLGDQHAALLGQRCFATGDAKNTYGTGNFFMLNTGETVVRSSHGLISTVAFQLEGRPAHFALEGSVAVTGSAVQWLRDQLGVISSAAESEALAASVEGTEGLYFVPAFSGLFAPYWRPDARGTIVGLTRAHNRAHLVRAALEATAFQSLDVLEAAHQDSGVAVRELRVDGGMARNNLCMQLQADILGVPVVRAAYPETTVLGAAVGAGLGAGVWSGPDALPPAVGALGDRFEPRLDAATRQRRVAEWHRAVERSLGWLA